MLCICVFHKVPFKLYDLVTVASIYEHVTPDSYCSNTMFAFCPHHSPCYQFKFSSSFCLDVTLQTLFQMDFLSLDPWLLLALSVGATALSLFSAEQTTDLLFLSRGEFRIYPTQCGTAYAVRSEEN